MKVTAAARPSDSDPTKRYRHAQFYSLWHKNIRKNILRLSTLHNHIQFMLYFLLHEQMLLGLIGLLTSFWWDRLINVGYKAHFAHSTKQQDQQCFALQNCGYFHVSASQEKAEKMVLEGGQFYLMEHHGSLCWLLLFATLDKIVFSPNKVYQGQQPATKKLHQQQRYFLFSLNTHRIWSTLLKA